jgi:glutathionylspermidine synthase
MRIVKHPVHVDVPKLLEEEMPWLRSFYTHQDELVEDAKQHFGYHIANQANLPFYAISEVGMQRIQHTATKAYEVMLNALDYAFANRDMLFKHFDCEMLRSQAGRAFVDYAAWTYEQKSMLGQSLYSRFDFAIDPVAEAVTGIYELNADTPTMLFESTVLQSHLLGQHYDIESQSNDWYEGVTNALKECYVNKSHRIGVVFDSEYVDDSATCEIIAQALDQFGNAMMVDIRALGFESLRIDKPFEAYGITLDGMFVLVPWEDMVEKHPESILQWERWCTNVAVMEPAYKWFMTNKGIFSLITELQEAGMFDTQGVPFIPTYLGSIRFAAERQWCVRKPKVGRMSGNVQIIDETGTTVQETDGPYESENMVYQQYVKPGSLVEGRNFLGGVWMSPQAAKWGKLANATGFAIREFGSAVNDFDEEQFMPHVIID